ncbi:dihydrofolate reductase family protein [Arthrobacter sp. Br18]|uniref:dihydrofolate reductase family protein n=1 Tax=Arthrobacter sp. Br18 TaxID=1312954 RepID=UPI000478A6D7|nr:dihydrofolate reductase family protein [Arthrobacter sp. Br18]
MTRTIFSTATSLNGYIADEANSLGWLFAVEPPDPQDQLDFLAGIGVLVEGSTTYEWVLRQEQLLQNPGKWNEFYGNRPTFVFTTRDLPVPTGADVRCVNGPVTEVYDELEAAADGRDIWVVGGGDLAGQFLDAGLLDEIQLFVAPVALSTGAPLLPRRLESDRLTLRSAQQRGQFAYLVYDVARG